MKEQFVKLADVQYMLDNAGIVTDGEYSGYCTEGVRIWNLPVYEFENPDLQDRKTEEPVSLCKYRNEDKCSMYCSGFDTTCDSYEPVDKE